MNKMDVINDFQEVFKKHNLRSMTITGGEQGGFLVMNDGSFRVVGDLDLDEFETEPEDNKKPNPFRVIEGGKKEYRINRFKYADIKDPVALNFTIQQDIRRAGINLNKPFEIEKEPYGEDDIIRQEERYSNG